MKKKEKIIIGRKDKATFPEWNLEDIPIKMDTGAYTSAIHYQSLQQKEVNGKKVLAFKLLDKTHPQYNDKEFLAEHYKEKKVKNSFGGSEKRFVIATTIKLFDKVYPIELSLSKRGEMRFPILIGRKFLIGKFIVDSSKNDLSFKQENKQK